MKHKLIVAHKQKIDAIFLKANDLNGDAELLSHWSRYLCVLVSGFVEASVRTILSEFASKRAQPEISGYVGKQLRGFQNAKMNKILALTSEFGSYYKDKIEKVVEGELRDAIDSIVRNRHLIAHGEEVGIGFDSIKRYYKSAVKAIEEIEQCFNP
jgi:RiboL-PSP-HEPN